MNRVDAIKHIYKENPDSFFIISNGLTSREAAYKLNKPKTFYLLHAMGEALSVGIGLALAQPTLDIVVIDGDGNALMGSASYSMNIANNLKYYILRNGVYQTTGSQKIPNINIIPDWAIIVDINNDRISSPNPPAPRKIWENFKHGLRDKSKDKLKW